MKERVLVAMSGGVDSSVAAYLLKKEGYDVVGVTFQLYDYSRLNRKEGKGGCCSLEDVDDAKHVCEKLGIQHYLFDSRERFKERVLDYFASSYKAGQTPNPCVACNTFIKFDELAHYAKAVDAKFYATGHYAQIRREDGKVYLEAAVDASKDQSYFLMGVDPEKLKHVLFPVGGYTKDQIRALAIEANLPVCDKPDSMEICFVSENNYRKFLEEEYKLSDNPGNIINEAREVIGKHKGVHHFTVGQRKGLPSYGLDSHYVLEINAETKEVMVGVDRSLFSEGLAFDGKNFLGFDEFVNRSLKVKIRSRSPMIDVKLVPSKGPALLARFETPQRAVTPGQFAVFYDGKRVVGGGPILKPVANFADVG
ncbi:MAG: tRNA-specific 2-thiouridylase MnmA [Bacteriovoracaceae bacterium]|nr:tRNA-specific 2-thiouridylase MnmA [Bacteriovoracaceae bacterium]